MVRQFLNCARNAWKVISQIMWFEFLNHANTAAKFRSIFNEFPFFNYVQSKALDDVSIIWKPLIIECSALWITLKFSLSCYYLIITYYPRSELQLWVSARVHLCLVCSQVLYTGRNFVACAPTGSGKTVLFELAIIRLLMETSEPWRDVKAVYSEHNIV